MNPIIRKMMEAEAALDENFEADGKIYLVRCPECGRENWSGAVASGICCWCGYDANGEPPKDFRPEHLKRMGVTISKGGVDE